MYYFEYLLKVINQKMKWNQGTVSRVYDDDENEEEQGRAKRVLVYLKIDLHQFCSICDLVFLS